MATQIQNMINNVLGDGARATKFECEISFPNVNLFEDTKAITTLVKATNIPGKSYNTIDFKYKGRSIPIKGQVKYEQNWECTFYLTEDHKLKHAFETWIEALDQRHSYHNDVSRYPGLEDTRLKHDDLKKYTTDIKIKQLNFDGDQITSQYTLINAFPMTVSNVSYSYESVGTVQEFTVTFAYSHFFSEVFKGKDGNFVDTLVKDTKNLIGDTIDDIMGSAANAVGGAINSVASGVSSAISGLAPDTAGISPNTLNNTPASIASNTNTETANEVEEQFIRSEDTMVTTVDDEFNTRKYGHATRKIEHYDDMMVTYADKNNPSAGYTVTDKTTGLVIYEE